MRLGSLFSGIGGFEAGAERCGLRTAWQCEIEPFQRRVLAKHWPGVTQYDDVRAVDPRSVEPIDLLCGGFPCQDLSVAGKRAGLAGERSGLFWEIVRLADTLRPNWLVLENVPGLLSSNGGADMATVVGALNDLGYLGAWRVLDAQWFGVAQRRRRVFLVGCLGAERLAAVLPFLASGQRHPAPRRQAGKDVAPTLEAGINRTGGHRFPGTCADTCLSLIPLQSVNRGEKRQNGVGVGGDVTHTLNGADQHGIAYAWDEELNGRREVAGTIARGGDGGRHSGVAIAFAQNQRDEVRELPGVAGALAAEPGMKQQTYIAATLPASGAGTARPGGQNAERDFYVPSASNVRRLTPTECERLQGFSWREGGEWRDGWTCLCGKNRGRSVGETPCTCPDGPRYRALGNAVAVPCVEWIFRQIVAAESAVRPKLPADPLPRFFELDARRKQWTPAEEQEYRALYPVVDALRARAGSR